MGAIIIRGRNACAFHSVSAIANSIVSIIELVGLADQASLQLIPLSSSARRFPSDIGIKTS